MSEYSLTKPLPSCMVDQVLLQELEEYLHKKVKEAVPLPEGNKEYLGLSAYDVVIEDAFGEETFKSVTEIDRTYFPDDTKEIRMHHRARNKENTMDVRIKFSASSMFPQFSDLKISFEGDSAREFVTGLTEQIFHRLQPYRTINSYFRFTLSRLIITMGLVWIVPFGIGYGAVHPTVVGKLVMAISISLIILLITWVILLLLKPYITFNTRRNQKIDKSTNWLFAGVLAFILFTVIGVYFRQKLFGF